MLQFEAFETFVYSFCMEFADAALWHTVAQNIREAILMCKLGHTTICGYSAHYVIDEQLGMEGVLASLIMKDPHFQLYVNTVVRLLSVSTTVESVLAT